MLNSRSLQRTRQPRSGLRFLVVGWLILPEASMWSPVGRCSLPLVTTCVGSARKPSALCLKMQCRESKLSWRILEHPPMSFVWRWQLEVNGCRLRGGSPRWVRADPCPFSAVQPVARGHLHVPLLHAQRHNGPARRTRARGRARVRGSDGRGGGPKCGCGRAGTESVGGAAAFTITGRGRAHPLKVT